MGLLWGLLVINRIAPKRRGKNKIMCILIELMREQVMGNEEN